MDNYFKRYAYREGANTSHDETFSFLSWSSERDRLGASR